MKKKILFCAMLGAMSMAHSAMAQDFDDRWYISGTVGILGTDNDRNTSNDAIFGIGVGKMVSQNVSVDVELDRANLTRDLSPKTAATGWDLTSLGVTGRYHFIKEGRNWWPYLAAGIGAQKNHYSGFAANSNGDANLFVKVGAGLQADVSERVDIRIEGGTKFDFNDSFNVGHYQDLYATASVLFALGDLPAPVVPDAPDAPPAADCSTKDDDGDGVNNCNDRCPNSQAGQAIGPDGCPVPLTIDLKGVNFDFDKDTLRPDAVVILDEAADILNKYPQLRVEVAGHTDSVGAEAYNQGLSQRRAQVVYNYLTGKGVDAARLVGPNGFGELKPIDVNTTKEGRARNRRTELNVQN